MKKVQRFRVGMIVQSDVTGTGDWVVGTIAEVDAKSSKVRMEVPGDKDPLWVHKSGVYKATQEELSKFSEAFDTGTVAESQEEPKEKTGEATSKPNLAGSEALDRIIKAEISERMNGWTLDDQYKMAEKAFGLLGVEKHGDMKTTVKGMKARWGHLNNGQQRMIMGNCIKKYLKKAGESEALRVLRSL